ncbi:MAG: acetyltransferase [Clostridiales bacterium]|jgi:sugar O-acyltransferase (sialic acid O-acetyltransferase NeuD family)|nr:acetyltransferase [Clostridiales bacterium]
MRDKLLIIGASGHGKVVADIAIRMNKWKSIAFLDDNEELNEIMGLQVIGKVDDVHRYKECADMFVAIGNNVIRKKIMTVLINDMGITLPVLIHPHAVVAREVRLGAGTVLMAGAIINSCTNIGEGCIINTGATIDHDTIIEDYVHVSPGVNIAGNVRIGYETWLGIGSKVSNNITIPSSCIIGAGAVVIEDITEPGTYVGVPARKI